MSHPQGTVVVFPITLFFKKRTNVAEQNVYNDADLQRETGRKNDWRLAQKRRQGVFYFGVGVCVVVCVCVVVVCVCVGGGGVVVRVIFVAIQWQKHAKARRIWNMYPRTFFCICILKIHCTVWRVIKNYGSTSCTSVFERLPSVVSSVTCRRIIAKHHFGDQNARQLTLQNQRWNYLNNACKNITVTCAHTIGRDSHS